MNRKKHAVPRIWPPRGFRHSLGSLRGVPDGQEDNCVSLLSLERGCSWRPQLGENTLSPCSGVSHEGPCFSEPVCLLGFSFIGVMASLTLKLINFRDRVLCYNPSWVGTHYLLPRWVYSCCNPPASGFPALRISGMNQHAGLHFAFLEGTDIGYTQAIS